MLFRARLGTFATRASGMPVAGQAAEYAQRLLSKQRCVCGIATNPMFPKHFVLAALPHTYRACDEEPLGSPINTGTGIDWKGTAANR